MLLVFTAIELGTVVKLLRDIDERIEAVTTTTKDFLGRDITVIRTRRDS